SLAPFLLLFVALLIALGFEFVNGFHDTANAVATVIYTRSLPANVAVVWSGMFNLFGVLMSTGAVAFGIVSLLPVELILQVGSGVGLANAMLRGRDGTSGVDWSQAAGIAKALLLSPVFGFVLAAGLLFILKTLLVKATPALFAEPKGDQPPPAWIR